MKKNLEFKDNTLDAIIEAAEKWANEHEGRGIMLVASGPDLNHDDKADNAALCYGVTDSIVYGLLNAFEAMPDMRELVKETLFIMENKRKNDKKRQN